MHRSNSMAVCSLPLGIVPATALHPLLCCDMACAIAAIPAFAGTEPAEAPYAGTGIITHDGNGSIKSWKPSTDLCFSL